jgi:hypothetical protein
MSDEEYNKIFMKGKYMTSDNKKENVSIIKSNKCKDCFYWNNLPDIAYNNVHDNFKECIYKNIVKKSSMVCENFKNINE